MVYRFSWIAGIAAIGLAFWQLSSILRDSVVGTPWQVVIIASTLLGAGITWTVIAYRAPGWVVAVVNIGAFVLLAGLIVAPDTLYVVLPTPDTWNVVFDDLRRAFDIIRSDVEPVRPVAGLILLISLLFWTLGFLLTAGLLNDRPFVALLTPLIVSVQFAIIDRKPKSIAQLGLFILVVAFVLIAIRADERDRGTGRLQRVNASAPPSRRPTPAIGVLVSATVVAGLFAVGLIGTVVPSDGFVTWRSASGYADGYSGNASYNPFVDIKAGLINKTDNPLFTSHVLGADPAAVRYRTVTLDVYSDGKWGTSRIHSFPLDEEPWIDPEQSYRGETTQIDTEITIQNLHQPWLPAPATPSSALGRDLGDSRTMRVRRLDGSLFFRDPTYKGMQYAVRADVPTLSPRILGQLARTESGELSPLFKAAEAAGESIPGVVDANEILEINDAEFWVEVPDEIGQGVRSLALSRTTNMETNFEKALALEHYFRLSGEFEYDTQVPSTNITGDVSDWLTDDENPYARHGYCEQFATAMALMGRTIGIPSRVVLGFTPGESVGENLVQVRDKNAHAWVEMWIPSYGWMSFDPTPRSGFAAPTANENLENILLFSPADYADQIPEPAPTPSTGSGGPSGGPLLPREEPAGGFVGLGGVATATSPWFDLPMWLVWAIGIIVVVGLVALMIPASKWWRRRRKLKRLRQGDIAAAWEDITDRLADLRDPVRPSATPLETAESFDEAFVPIANTYGESLYGERETTTSVIDTASEAHALAIEHMSTRYSTSERLRAAFRPTRLIDRWSSFFSRRKPQGLDAKETTYVSRKLPLTPGQRHH
jgi:hypothetical protein